MCMYVNKIISPRVYGATQRPSLATAALNKKKYLHFISKMSLFNYTETQKKHHFSRDLNSAP